MESKIKPSVVEAPDKAIIKANLNYSLYVTMDSLKELIKIEARKYFTELDDPDSIELISDKWIAK
jgi:hypothetical protein